MFEINWQGSGVFYVSYVLCQIPSNLLLSRLGAKLWLPMITAAFGAVSLCSGLFIKSPASFYALRLALGITEAGGAMNSKGKSCYLLCTHSRSSCGTSAGPAAAATGGGSTEQCSVTATPVQLQISATAGPR